MPADLIAHIPPFDPEILGDVAGQIINEIERQDDLARAGKFGGTHALPGGPDEARLRVLVEEVGEVAKELNEIDQGNSNRGDALLAELIQTAACAGAWAAAILEGRD